MDLDGFWPLKMVVSWYSPIDLLEPLATRSGGQLGHRGLGVQGRQRRPAGAARGSRGHEGCATRCGGPEGARGGDDDG